MTERRWTVIYAPLGVLSDVMFEITAATPRSDSQFAGLVHIEDRETGEEWDLTPDRTRALINALRAAVRHAEGETE